MNMEIGMNGNYPMLRILTMTMGKCHRLLENYGIFMGLGVPEFALKDRIRLEANIDAAHSMLDSGYFSQPPWQQAAEGFRSELEELEKNFTSLCKSQGNGWGQAYKEGNRTEN